MLSSEDYPSVEYEDIISNSGELNKDIRSKQIRKSGILFDNNDVLYGKLRPYLHNWLNPDFKGVAVGDWWVMQPKKIDKNFLYRLIQTKKFDDVANQSSGSKMPRADWNLVSNSSFMLPSIVKEQAKIAELFTSLDRLITLHQRKYDKLVNIKKAMLEKMFPKDGAKVPEIRFKGFTDDWEQRKLGEYLIVSNEKNTDGIYGREDVLSVSGALGIVNQIEFKGRSFAGVSVSNYGVVENGDVVYTKSPLNNNPYGIIKANKGQTGIVSTLYAVYHPGEGTDSNFVQTYFEQNSRMNNYMHPLVNKGAKNDMKVSSENALKGYVIFPNSKEQKIIYDFFARLDRLITLHQRKLEKLQNLKQACLEKLFV